MAAFAEQTDRAFYLHGSHVTPAPELGKITADHTLREESLPSEEDWEQARTRAAAIFGVHQIGLRRGRLVGLFARDVKTAAERHKDAVHTLVKRLDERGPWLQLAQETGRLATARAAADLVEALVNARSAKDTVERLARAELIGPADRLGKSISSAAQVAGALAAAPWDTFEIVAGLSEPHAAQGAVVLSELRRLAQADELTAPLAPALRRAQVDATALLRVVTGGGSGGGAGGGSGSGSGSGGSSSSNSGSGSGGATMPAGSREVRADGLDEVVADLRKFAEAHGDAVIEVSWRIVP